MTAIATIAREAATHFEAKKTGFGQAQDGWSLTLRIQDNDVPAHVRDARKGTRYMVALVEIGDDEQPIKPKGGDASVPGHGPTTKTPETQPRPAAQKAGADKPKRRFDEMTPATQAGMLCHERAFRAFLREEYPLMWTKCCDEPTLDEPDTDEEVAAKCVRELCNVDSRADIKPNNVEWSSLVLAYRLWQHEPEFVG